MFLHQSGLLSLTEQLFQTDSSSTLRAWRAPGRSGADAAQSPSRLPLCPSCAWSAQPTRMIRRTDPFISKLPGWWILLAVLSGYSSGWPHIAVTLHQLKIIFTKPYFTGIDTSSALDTNTMWQHDFTFFNLSELGIGTLWRFASCSIVSNMFFSFRSKYLDWREKRLIIRVWLNGIM